MLTAILEEKSHDKLALDILEASKWAKAIEWRFDRGVSYCPELRKLPSIFKILPSQVELVAHTPEFVDIDHADLPRLLPKVRALSPKTKIITSYHNFEAMPDDLNALYKRLKALGGDEVKIAATPQSSCDALKLITFVKPDLTVVPMGRWGVFARLLAPICGQKRSYALVKPSTLSQVGLMTFDEMESIYHRSRLSKKTKLFALIGSPLEQSFSHIAHNAYFRQEGIDALFVKIEVKPDELDDFMTYLPLFEGLAVTIPHKMKVGNYLKKGHPSTAINTIFRGEGENTDGRAALDAIEERVVVRDKKVVIFGAGGCARAIAYEATLRGAQVTMLGRSVLKDIERLDGDILVNATPCGMAPYIGQSPIPLKLIQSHHLLFEAVARPKVTPFIRRGLDLHCSVVYGEEMFERQAAFQRAIWRQSRRAPERV